MLKGIVTVSLKQDVLDPQGQAVLHSLQSLGFNEAKNVRIGKSIEVWLEENEVLFGRSHWFMLDANKKKQGYVKPNSECYKWVEKKLDKDPNW